MKLKQKWRNYMSGEKMSQRYTKTDYMEVARKLAALGLPHSTQGQINNIRTIRSYVTKEEIAELQTLLDKTGWIAKGESSDNWKLK